MGRYHSRHEAYPFLSDPGGDLRCDFEIFTDFLCSNTGLLRAKIPDTDLQEELLLVGELIYHINPALRMGMEVTAEEVSWLEGRVHALTRQTSGRCETFVLPQGTEAACLAHTLRVQCKALVRLLYRWEEAGNSVDALLFDFANLLSGYFFALGLWLNKLAGVDEIPFVSRSYH